MKCEIVPLKGLNGIRFGMDVKAVREQIGAGFKSFKRTPDASFPCDHFVALGVFANYDKSGRLEAIEMGLPAAPELYGINLLGMSFDAAVKFLAAKDREIERESDGAISRGMGISLYAPYASEDPKIPPESVLLFVDGYYD